MQTWVSTGGLAVVGVGVAVAGRLVDVSPAWRTLSYVIAIGLLLAVVLEIIGQNDYATLVAGITSGILVTIWAILLARRGSSSTTVVPAA